MRGLGRLHRAATIVVGAQLLIWTATGLAFTCFDFAAVRGAGDRLPEPALPEGAPAVRVDEAIARARARRHGAAAVAVELRTRLDRAVFIVRFAAADPVVVDAGDGCVLDAARADEAAAIARARFRGAPPVAGVTLLTSPRAAPDLPLPVWRVRFSDARGTEAFVAPSTGELVGWRNASWRRFDRLWSLHVLGWVSRDSPAQWPLRILAALALAVAVSGLALLVAPLWRARRGG